MLVLEIEIIPSFCTCVNSYGKYRFTWILIIHIAYYFMRIVTTM